MDKLVQNHIKDLADEGCKTIQGHRDEILKLMQPQLILIPPLEKGQITKKINLHCQEIESIQKEKGKLIEALMDKVPEIEKLALWQYVREKLDIDKGEKGKNDSKNYKPKPLEKGLSNIINKEAEKEDSKENQAPIYTLTSKFYKQSDKPKEKDKQHDQEIEKD